MLLSWRSKAKKGLLTSGHSAGEKTVPATQYAQTLDKIQRLRRLLGRAVSDNELLKEAAEMMSEKIQCALSLIREGHPIKAVSRVLGLARSNLETMIHRNETWTDKRLKANRTDSAESDQSILSDIMGVLKVFPSFGYLRISAVIAQKRRNLGEPPVNHTRIYRIIHQFNLTLPQKLPLHGFSSDHQRHVAVTEPDHRWCSDGLEFRFLNGEIVTITFVIDCCEREYLSLVAKSGKGLTSLWYRTPW